MRPSIAATILLTSLAAGCGTYAQHRAALVPHATAIPYDGQPVDATGQLGIGATNIADPVAPGTSDPAAGDSIPTTQLRSDLAARLGSNAFLGAVYEEGLAAGQHAVTSTQPPVPGGDVRGYGFAFGISAPIWSDPRWRIGLSTEVMFWSIPWIQYTSCVTSCVAGTDETSGRDVVPRLSFAITPSFRTGRWTVFGSLSASNQPTVTETIETNDPIPDANVQFGDFNATLALGVEYEFMPQLRGMLIAQETVTDNPIAYWPSLAAMIRIPLDPDRRQ